MILLWTKMRYITSYIENSSIIHRMVWVSLKRISLKSCRWLVFCYEEWAVLTAGFNNPHVSKYPWGDPIALRRWNCFRMIKHKTYSGGEIPLAKCPFLSSSLSLLSLPFSSIYPAEPKMEFSLTSKTSHSKSNLAGESKIWVTCYMACLKIA